MTPLLLDNFADAAPWSPLAPDGDPSTQIVVSSDGASLLIDIQDGANGHRVRRSLASQNLSAFEEIRLLVNADRSADGSSARPFFLELRLGSAANEIDSETNPWRRVIPVRRPATWESVRFSLADVPANVRNALTQIQLRALTNGPAAIRLDTLLAVKEDLIADVEAELVRRLSGQISIDGDPVAAVVDNPDAAAPELPHIRIFPGPLDMLPDRGNASGPRWDYTEESSRIDAVPVPVSLTYEIDVFAATRADQAAMLDAVLRSLAGAPALEVNGNEYGIQWLPPVPANMLNQPTRPRLRFQVNGWLRVGGASRVPRPFGEVSLDVEQPEVVR